MFPSSVLIRTRYVRVAESWLDEVPEQQSGQLAALRADVVYFREALRDTSSTGFYRAASRHGMINLAQPPETLLDAMNPGFRNEVRRAAKEGVQSHLVRVSPDAPHFTAELADYTKFHTERKLIAMPHHSLRIYATAGMLWSATASIDQIPIRTHFYICSAREALLIASFPRTLRGDIKPVARGWANRRLHFDCVAHFHQAGCLRYNLGGIGNAGSSNNEDIIKFKMEMRPETAIRYSYAQALSFKGHLFLLARKFVRG